MNFYTQMIGGIGDILLYMMKPGSPLGFFRSMHHRGDVTMVVAHANTDEAVHLFTRLPFVDHLRFRGRSIKVDTAPGQRFDIINRYSGLTWERPRLVLDEEEQRILDDLTTEPYVAVHVSASLQEKVPPKFEALLDGLRAANVRTVLLGIESTDNLPAIKGNRLHGFLGAEGSGQIILPPKLRLHVAVAQHASKFIGTLSCFNCAAQLASVPSFVLVNRALQEPNVYRMMHMNGAIIQPWNVGRPVEDIYREAVAWAK